MGGLNALEDRFRRHEHASKWKRRFEHSKAFVATVDIKGDKDKSLA
jgi:hypothetical protein